eukprot:13536786-Heterocapsa_arctica.AAC.1
MRQPHRRALSPMMDTAPHHSSMPLEGGRPWSTLPPRVDTPTGPSMGDLRAVASAEEDQQQN